MNDQKLNRFIHVLALLTFLALSNISCASPFKSKSNQIETNIEEISFSPQFVLVRQPNQVTISAKLTAFHQHFPSRKLVLQQQRFLPNGRTIFTPVAVLRDDGKKGDTVENDGVYTTKVDFNPRFLGDIHLRIVAKHKSKKGRGKSESEIFTLPVKNACGPTASLLPIKVLEPATGNSRYQIIEFDIPGSTAEPRATILRVVNGARLGSPMNERIYYADLWLNGSKIMRLNKSTNIAEIPVSLNAGLNTLKIVRIRSKPGQLLAVEIQACADQLELTPVSETLSTGSTLSATATVTAQGVPVKGAEIQFDVSDSLAADHQKTAISSDSGIAHTDFILTNAGNGQLIARVVDASPDLTASTEILAVNTPSMELNQGFDELSLTPGENESLPFFLFYLSHDPTQQQLTFNRTVEPDNGGLLISGGAGSADGYMVNGPASFNFEPVITAVSPGDYKVIARAVILGSGETVSATTTVHVADPNAPEPLTLNLPGFTPAGIEPGISTTVTVRALAEGTTTPPTSLWLDEIDADGNLVTLGIAELKDGGQGADNVAGDYLYTAQTEFNRPIQQNIYLRLRAPYFGDEILSNTAILTVTPFELEGPQPDNDQLVPGSSEDELVFANEILVQLISGTSPARAETIAASINGEIVSIIPEIRLYRIQFAGDGTFQGVQQAIANLSLFSDVIFAVPNSEVIPAGTSCDWNNPANDCPQDPAFPAQWHLNKIRAKQAWEAAMTINPREFAGSSAFPVAVIDVGLNCSHTDLIDQCLNTVSNNDEHGTAVAGIIAANANEIGGTGVAWNSKLRAYRAGTDLNSLSNSIIAAGNSDAKILNVSMTSASTTGLATLRAAICDVAVKGKLIVAAAGQRPTGSALDLYPAALNDDESYLCPNSDVNLSSHLLSVGASNASDRLAVWSGINSNPKDWVDIYAPGLGIIAFSTAYNGTSYAAPQVSGAAALLWPLLPSGSSPTTLHNRLLASAQTIGDLDGNGEADKRLDLLAAVADNKVTINFVTEDAAFRNTFGIYNRVTREARILVDNVDLQSNPDLAGFETTLYLTDQDLANLEFFLIPNGASRNAIYLLNTPSAQRKLEVFQDNDNKWRLRDLNNNTVLFGAVGEADALFSDPAINPDPGREQTRTSGTPSNYHLHWEDRPASTSDNDYNDAEFSITIQAL